jgi:outer membrane biosynthesis protein TonB
MNVEARSDTMSRLGPEWQGAVVNGKYPLQRLLHASDSSALFLTRADARQGGDAAIRIIPAERVLTAMQLRQWPLAAALNEPYLVKLFDFGHCQVGVGQYLYVVMEYADQTLAQLLPRRALSTDEVREMLLPTVDALALLHRRGMVHGEVNPASLLVVSDRLKLSSDGIRAAGEPRARLSDAALYDPPEANQGRFAPSGDMWSLGITIVEALTRSVPHIEDQSTAQRVAAALPAPFAELARRCLDLDPAARPSAVALQSELASSAHVAVATPASAPAAPSTPPVRPSVAAPARAAPPPLAPVARPRPATPAPAPAARTPRAASAATRAAPEPLLAGEPLAAPPPSRGSFESGPLAPGRHLPRAAIGAVAGVLVLLTLWSLAHRTRAPESVAPTAAPPAVSEQPLSASRARIAPPAASSTLAEPAAVASHAARAADVPATPAGVLHSQLPNPSHGALATIHGHIRVAVLVTVDRHGNVSDERLENAGPSQYFARLSREAARKWQFAPSDQAARTWMLHFEYSQHGVTAHESPRP